MNRYRTALLLMALGIATGACQDGSNRPVKEATSKSPPALGSRSNKPVSAPLMPQVFTWKAASGNPSMPTVQVGVPTQGTLGSNDPTLSPGLYFDEWMFSAPQAGVLTVSLTSTDFDALLGIGEGEGLIDMSIVAEDDDGGEGTNALASVSVQPGVHTVIASSYGAGSGSYTLTLDFEGDGTGSSARAAPNELRVGASAAGELSATDPALTEGSHYDLWTYRGAAGERVRISMTAPSLDTYLMVLFDDGTPSGRLVAENDDANGTDSEVVAVLPETGTYVMVATSFGEGETGSYSLSVQGDGIASPTDWARRFPGGGDPNGRYALLVGINDYPGVGSDLSGPVEDATLMRDVLIEQYDFDPSDIVMLTDSDANRVAIAQGFVRHLGQAGPDGVAVFFYSGHGMPMDDNRGLTAPFDPEPGDNRDEALYIWGETEDASVLLDDELGFLAERLRAERTLILIDACYSGTGSRGASEHAKLVRPSEVRDELTLPKSFITTSLGRDLVGDVDWSDVADIMSEAQRHVMMASSTENQLSWTLPASAIPDRDEPASLWTYYLAQGMRTPGATFSDLNATIHRNVTEKVNSLSWLEQQDAQVLGANQRMTLEEFFRQR